MEPDEYSREYRKNWSRLIQKIYEPDPPTCTKCSGKMKMISVIDDEPVESLQIEREVTRLLCLYVT